jgi:DNA-binding transcriptional MerR regulator
LGSPRELVKLYYRIGEVAQIVGVQPHVLRYWETEFRTIRPQKSHKGQRVYSRRDVEKLLKVKDLLKNQGFTIAGARKKLRDPDQVADVVEAASKPAAPAPVEAVERLVEAAVVAQAPSRSVDPRAVDARAADVRAADAAEETRARMRDALLAIREDIRAMLGDLDTPRPRRPKLPTLP